MLTGLSLGQVVVGEALDAKVYLPAKVASAALDVALQIKSLFPSESVLMSSGPGWRAALSNARDNLFLAFNYADFGRGDSHQAMRLRDVQVLGTGDVFFCYHISLYTRGVSSRVIESLVCRAPMTFGVLR